MAIAPAAVYRNAYCRKAGSRGAINIHAPERYSPASASSSHHLSFGAKPVKIPKIREYTGFMDRNRKIAAGKPNSDGSCVVPQGRPSINAAVITSQIIVDFFMPCSSANLFLSAHIHSQCLWNFYAAVCLQVIL